MAYTVRDFVGFLMGTIPQMSSQAARDIVKAVWEEVVDEREWGFLRRNGTLYVPASASEQGTVAVTIGSTTVTFNATALAAVNATNVGSFRPIVGRQFRQPTGGAVYTITAYDAGTGVATLDREWDGDTDAALTTWQVYKSLYTPPGGLDFQKYYIVVDVDSSYRLRLNYQQQEISKSDPQRNAFGLPYIVAFADHGDPTIPGALRHELWPSPVSKRDLRVLYTSKGLTDHNGVSFPANTYEFPLHISSAFLRARGRLHAYKWAEAHKGAHESLQGPNWRFLWQQAEQDDAKLLAQAKREDKTTTTSGWTTPYLRWPLSPIDGAFAQANDVDWIVA